MGDCDSSTVTILDIVYDFDRKELKWGIPESVGFAEGTNECENPTGIYCETQEIPMTREVQRETSSSWTHTAGTSHTFSLGWKAGIPEVSEKELTYSATIRYEFSYDKTYTDTKSSSSTTSCKAKPGTYMKCNYLSRRAFIKVPFTLYYSNGDTSEGVYNGVDWSKLNPVGNVIYWMAIVLKQALAN